MSDTPEMICKGCGKPIVPFEPRYAGNERHDEYWHYDCWAGTATGAKSIEYYRKQAEAPAKPRTGKTHLDGKHGRDGHCPDGFLCEGWRLVRKGGRVKFGHSWHHHEFLEDMVGEYVFCQISDWTGIEIDVYPWGLSNRDADNGRIYPERVKDSPEQA